MNPNLAEVGKPTRWPPDQSGNPAGIERSILACWGTGHSPVGRIDRAGGPLVVAIAEACNTRPVAAPLRAADAALFVILRAVLGCHHLPGCDWPWHFDRRLADRTDRRIQNYPIDAGAGLLRFGGWRHHALRGDIFGHSSVYHTHRNGSIIRVGAARKVSAVRWNIAANIVVAWIVTLPASGIAAALCYFVVGLFRQWIAPG